MDVTKTATDGLLKTLAWLHPSYAPLLEWLEGHEDTLVAVGPMIAEAAKEGPGALAAAEQAAPDLASAVKHFVQASPVASGNPQVIRLHAENVTRRIVGAPVLTEDQEHEFLSQDSKSGSA
jgi:hypothetical protein